DVKSQKLRIAALAATGAALVVAGCAAMQGAGGGEDRATREAIALMKRDFKPRGQATLDRLDQDDLQKVCTRYAEEAAKIPDADAKRMEQAQLVTIKYPADGRYLGDWKAGEKVAQTGKGKQWNDDPKKPGGGNCYACHQISKQELSYGTIGPSLYHFGRTRGFGPDMQKYVYAKVYNSHAFAACSSMPRFGAHGILSEQQIKDVVALLLDPNSPVNQ
ncbi:MAG TPA: sulfur oxidation c-type cytochrome SoxX, partial [Usitatibacter sp.]|nr:sulfur oxidation c-type cytochrome SoxX [Usitatibacter sp.]